MEILPLARKTTVNEALICFDDLATVDFGLENYQLMTLRANRTHSLNNILLVYNKDNLLRRVHRDFYKEYVLYLTGLYLKVDNDVLYLDRSLVDENKAILSSNVVDDFSFTLTTTNMEINHLQRQITNEPLTSLSFIKDNKINFSFKLHINSKFDLKNKKLTLSATVLSVGIVINDEDNTVLSMKDENYIKLAKLVHSSEIIAFDLNAIEVEPVQKIETKKQIYSDLNAYDYSAKDSKKKIDNSSISNKFIDPEIPNDIPEFIEVTKIDGTKNIIPMSFLAKSIISDDGRNYRTITDSKNTRYWMSVLESYNYLKIMIERYIEARKQIHYDLTK